MSRLFIFSILLLLTSCRTTKEITNRVSEKHLTDSVSELRIIRTIPIPEARVEMTIPILKIADLPDNASYSKRNGRAHVKISKTGDAINIVATCDSLQALCEYYKRELLRIRNDTGIEKTVIEERSNCIKTPFKGIFFGFLAGVLFSFSFRFKV